jgi:hypothetical protein
VANSLRWEIEIENQGDEQPLPFHLPLCLGRKIFQLPGLPANSQVGVCAFATARSCDRIRFSVLDPNPAAEIPNDRSVIAQPTDSPLLLLSRHQR